MAFNFDDALDTAVDATGKAIKFVSGQSATTTNPKDFEKDGFIVPPMPNADGNGLPSQKVASLRVAEQKRKLMHWFVPEFGIVKMYINPQSIRSTDTKIIQKDRTKGGYTLQYWGEELTQLQIQGTTGSSGYEGINVLREIYRAEQYAFDAVGLTLASDNAKNSAANQLIGGIRNAIGNTIVSGLFGVDQASQTLAQKNLPSLAQYAFGIEMFYMGLVHRGYFTQMTINESVQALGLFDYEMTFMVTERRGYRINSMPWQRSAISGPSNHDVIPLSSSRLK